MKKKELKNLAKKIAENEYILQSSNDEYEKQQAKEEILKISSGVHSFEDLDLLDELIQENLNKLFTQNK